MSDETNYLAGDVYTALSSECRNRMYKPEEEVRSAPHSETVDVKVNGQWFRLSAAPIDEPISVEDHRSGQV